MGCPVCHGGHAASLLGCWQTTKSGTPAVCPAIADAGSHVIPRAHAAKFDERLADNRGWQAQGPWPPTGTQGWGQRSREGSGRHRLPLPRARQLTVQSPCAEPSRALMGKGPQERFGQAPACARQPLHHGVWRPMTPTCCACKDTGGPCRGPAPTGASITLDNLAFGLQVIAQHC